MRFPNAADGVSKIFTAEILALVAAACGLVGAIIAAIGAAVESAAVLGSLPFMLAAGILLIIALIINIIGVNKASKDEEKFKSAFLWLVLGIVASVIQGFFSENEIVSSIFQTLVTVFQLLSTIYVIQGSMALAQKLGNSDVEAMGNKALKLIIATYLIIVVINIVAAIFNVIEGSTALALIAAILGIVVFVLQIITYVIYLKMLSRAKKMLN